jgi:CheY-like chemotaxis protein
MVDDDPVSRKLPHRLLSRRYPFAELDQAANNQEAVAAVAAALGASNAGAYDVISWITRCRSWMAPQPLAISRPWALCGLQQALLPAARQPPQAPCASA